MKTAQGRGSASSSSITVLAAVVVLANVCAGPAEAQLHGVPVWSVRVPDVTYPFAVHLVGHGTTGDDFLGDTDPDLGLTLAARGAIAQLVAVSAGAGSIKRDVAVGEREYRWQYFVSSSVWLKRWTHPARPIDASLAVMGGWGRSEISDAANEQNVPVGLEFALSLGQGGWFIEPWIMPRWHWRRTRVSGGTEWQRGPAGSGGTAIKWSRWTAIASLDVISLGAVSSGNVVLPKTTSLAWSFGLQCGF